MLSWPLTGLKSTLIKKLTKSAKRAKKLERVKFLKYLLHFEREKVSKNAKNGSFWRFLENLVVFLRFMLLSKPAFFSPIFTSMVWHTYGNVMLSVPSDSYWLFCLKGSYPKEKAVSASMANVWWKLLWIN